MHACSLTVGNGQVLAAAGVVLDGSSGVVCAGESAVINGDIAGVAGIVVAAGAQIDSNSVADQCEVHIFDGQTGSLISCGLAVYGDGAGELIAAAIDGDADIGLLNYGDILSTSHQQFDSVSVLGCINGSLQSGIVFVAVLVADHSDSFNELGGEFYIAGYGEGECIALALNLPALEAVVGLTGAFGLLDFITVVICLNGLNTVNDPSDFVGSNGLFISCLVCNIAGNGCGNISFLTVYIPSVELICSHNIAGGVLIVSLGGYGSNDVSAVSQSLGLEHGVVLIEEFNCVSGNSTLKDSNILNALITVLSIQNRKVCACGVVNNTVFISIPTGEGEGCNDVVIVIDFVSLAGRGSIGRGGIEVKLVLIFVAINYEGDGILVCSLGYGQCGVVVYTGENTILKTCIFCSNSSGIAGCLVNGNIGSFAIVYANSGSTTVDSTVADGNIIVDIGEGDGNFQSSGFNGISTNGGHIYGDAGGIFSCQFN